MKKKLESPGKLYPLDEAARVELGGTSHWTLRAHIQGGTIPAVRIGKRIFLTEETLTRIKLQGLPSLTAKQRRIKPKTAA